MFDLRGMTALVTGATGMLGSHVTDLLVERGERVRVLVCPGDSAHALDPTNVELYWGDLRDRHCFLIRRLEH